MVILENSDFGTLAVCAIRYCMGSQSYMPDLVRSIIRPNIAELSDKDLMLLINDCENQEQLDVYGDSMIDKPSWVLWRMEIEAERNKRHELGKT